MTAAATPRLGDGEIVLKTAAEILMDPRLVIGPMSGEFNGREIELYADAQARELILYAISPQEPTIPPFTDGFPLDFRITLNTDSGKLTLEQFDHYKETPPVKFEIKDFTAADFALMANDILANGVDFNEKDEIVVEALILGEIHHEREVIKANVSELMEKLDVCSADETEDINARIRSLLAGLVNLDNRYDSVSHPVTDVIGARIGDEKFKKLLPTLIKLNPQIKLIKK